MKNNICSHRSSRNNEKKHCFTLTELLIVIAVIVILAALLPGLNAREYGRTATCSNNLKQITLGSQQYAADNDSYLPMWTNERKDFWMLKLKSYLGGEDYNKLFAKYGGGNSSFRKGHVNAGIPSKLICPSVSSGYYFTNYCVNGTFCPDWSSFRASGKKHISLNAVTQASTTLFILENGDKVGAFPKEKSAHGGNPNFTSKRNITYHGSAAYMAYPHNNYGNLAWIDGHVSSHTQGAANTHIPVAMTNDGAAYELYR